MMRVAAFFKTLAASKDVCGLGSSSFAEFVVQLEYFYQTYQSKLLTCSNTLSRV